MSHISHCMCPSCKDGTLHASDCAAHNMPAHPSGPCDCGALAASEARDVGNEEIEAVIACLGDDAAMLRGLDQYEEVSANMERAAELLATRASEAAPIDPLSDEGQRAGYERSPVEAAPVAVGDAKNGVTLTGTQLLAALDFIAPDRDTDREQLEGEVTIQSGTGHSGDGLYCWCAEYPGEGAVLLADEIDGSTYAPREIEPVPHWPYCKHCKAAFQFDAARAAARCDCGENEWNDARPAGWVPNPALAAQAAPSAPDALDEMTRSRNTWRALAEAAKRDLHAFGEARQKNGGK
jgi:hypothetical protein